VFGSRQGEGTANFTKTTIQFQAYPETRQIESAPLSYTVRPLKEEVKNSIL